MKKFVIILEVWTVNNNYYYDYALCFYQVLPNMMLLDIVHLLAAFF